MKGSVEMHSMFSNIWDSGVLQILFKWGATEEKQVLLYIMGRKLMTTLFPYFVEEKKLLSYVTQKEKHGFLHALLCPQESHTSQKMWILFRTAGKLNHQQWSKCIVYNIHCIYPYRKYKICLIFNLDQYTEDKKNNSPFLVHPFSFYFLLRNLLMVLDCSEEHKWLLLMKYLSKSPVRSASQYLFTSGFAFKVSF